MRVYSLWMGMTASAQICAQFRFSFTCIMVQFQSAWQYAKSCQITRPNLPFWHHVGLVDHCSNFQKHAKCSLAISGYIHMFISQPPGSESSLTLCHHCHDHHHDVHHHGFHHQYHHDSWAHPCWAEQNWDCKFATASLAQPTQIAPPMTAITFIDSRTKLPGVDIVGPLGRIEREQLT